LGHVTFGDVTSWRHFWLRMRTRSLSVDPPHGSTSTNTTWTVWIHLHKC